MHASLQTILRLYREPLPEGVPPAHEDPASVGSLAAVRDALDARPKARPDAFVLDQILAAAAHGAPVGPPESLGLRFDRHSVPRRRARFRRAFAVVATGAVAALFALVVLLPGGEPAGRAAAPVVATTERPAPVSVPAAAATEATALATPAPAALPVSAPAPSEAPRAAAPSRPAREATPADPAPGAEAEPWDAPLPKEAVERTASRVQHLATRLDSTLWDLPSTSSLALPRPGGRSAFTSASHTGND